ncbi:RNA pyrophosphohydrolase [Croceicoccus estronivorus]|uniref:RNA pyrophosphohydrolase n=1 Tax=Croceicoccus estronivorus TaxID=1172626 RepID=UPI0008311362|nr:RNA pyrophosphohydrolase [Croceicoccus estronivorus]OCC23126.1 RNA pyrophosphohydrolase [Croceicoccus estronivorus]
MTNPDPKLYRPCAGIMLVNASGSAFVGKRIDTKEGDWWQMPQGGIDKGEDSGDAALRELWEETGLLANKVRIEAQMARELYYDLPGELKGKLWKGKYIGQRQTWFLARLTGDDADIDLAAHNPPEFSAWKWVDPEILPALIIPFKQTIYRAVLEEFRPLI